ncbi:hypothetical protein B0H13DRAFT_1850941 [Mycena leptocephala]|nr:hypothetical protein B0H13DRAFT_1850941 [Mycena leptocephala]
MVRNSRSGHPLPLPDTFDLVAYAIRPADTPPTENMKLKQKNSHNLAAENHNEKSLGYTREYEEAKKNGTSLDGLDVGAPLRPFVSYTEDEVELMALDKEYRTAAGPLPFHVFERIAMARRDTMRAEQAEKARREKERADKEAEKDKSSIMGRLVRKNPHSMTSALAAAITIPDVYLSSLFYRLPLPIHWLTNEIIREANRNPFKVPRDWARGVQSHAQSQPERVLIVEVTKMEKLHGNEDDSINHLTPSTWLEASENMLTALKELCPTPEDPTEHTYYTEYDYHVRFFRRIKWFNSHFHVWFPVEQELREEIFNDADFDLAEYNARVNSAMHNEKQLDRRRGAS